MILAYTVYRVFHFKLSENFLFLILNKDILHKS